MSGIFTTLVSFAFVLGVLVFVHELGHFLAAKRVGIRVLKFQLGFNPTILSFQRGDTEYGIGALPLGGYVKMAGENPEEARTGKEDEFLSKSKWQRFQVLIMGPTMNILLAVVLTALVLYKVGDERFVYEDKPPVVGSVVENSPAAGAGIRPGDLIVSFKTWEDLENSISQKPNQALQLQLLRGTQTITVDLTAGSTGRGRFEMGDIGVMPDAHPHVPSVVPGEAADRAGVKDGDVIVAVDGKTITYSTQLREVIAKHPDQPITMSILRGGTPRTITVTPIKQAGIGRIGVNIQDDVVIVQPANPFDALRLSVRKNVKSAGMIFQALWGLVTREVSPKQLMGPVAIAQLSGESAALGWIYLVSLMASISLNLGLLNLMPIPVLDGGHIFIMALEGLARRDFSVRVKEKVLVAGFVLILMLMVTVIYNDLTRIAWIERLMPWR